MERTSLMNGRDLGSTFDNSYARALEGMYAPWQGAQVPSPRLARLNTALALELGLDPDFLKTAKGAAILAGSTQVEGTSPLAMVYAGHQFGGFSPQLGDGRALLVGEIIDRRGKRRDIHLKGSGPTPFSRNGDGKASLGPVLREYLIGEAMHALGIPSTRALAAVLTGEDVYRETVLPGAVLARVASSHLRVGTFQFFAARGDIDKTRRLADYAIERHYPLLANRPDRYLELLVAVMERQAELIAKWMLVGFVHGVMNTDNMTISGETIDYGPCAFLDSYGSATVFSSIDQMGRYAYGRQPAIAQWNLARLAESLLLLIDAEDTENAARLATNQLNKFPTLYQDYWLDGMRTKLGLTTAEEDDISLVNALFAAIEGQEVDFTILFRRLANAVDGADAPVLALVKDPSSMTGWLKDWRQRFGREGADDDGRIRAMNAVNPLYIARNHLVEEALSRAVEDDDMAAFDRLLSIVTNPYEPQDGQERYEQPAPADFGPYQTFCGT